MKITRTSVWSGITRTREIDISMFAYECWEQGALIQNVAPHLTPSDREFIISGMTDEEWAETDEK